MTSYHFLVVVFLLGYVQSHSGHAMNFPEDLEHHLRSRSEEGYKERNCSVGEECRLLQSCQSLYLLLEALNMDKVQILKKAQCGFVGRHPKVCCNINDQGPSPPTTFPPLPSDDHGESIEHITIFPRPSLPTGAPPSGGIGDSDPDGGGSFPGPVFPRPAPTFPPVGGGGRPAPPLPFPAQPTTSTSRPTTTTLRTSSVTNSQVSHTLCGAVPPSRALEGDVPQFGFYTWAVTLRFTDERSRTKLQCGGALVSERHVLTAAHCLEQSTRHHRTLSEIVIGDHSWNETPDCMLLQNGQRVCAKKEVHRTAASIMIHPNYVAKTRANDIAIIVLNASVPLASNSVPVCLPAPNQDITSFLRERRIQTSGWGLNTGSRPFYKEKHQISLKYEDPLVCSQYYNVTLRQGQLCFSSREMDKYGLKCTKDSGGALFTNFDVTGPPFTQVGIVSVAGRARCLSRNDMGPTIVTDVSYYLPWIYQHIAL